MSQLNDSQSFFDWARQLQGLLGPMLGVDDVTRINSKILVGLLKSNRTALEGYMAALDEAIQTLETNTPSTPARGRMRKVDVR